MVQLNIALILLTSSVFAKGSAQTVAYYPDVLEVGKEAVISCYEASKPPGGAYWDYVNDTNRYTNLCRVVLNDSVLEERSDCYGNTSVGIPVNFTFTIKSVSWNRDGGGNWKCLMPSNYVVLNIPYESMKVSESVDYNDKPQERIYRKDSATVTATINCHYPVSTGNTFWCLQRNDEGIKCSDDDNQFYNGVFEDDVNIVFTQPVNCSEYEGGLVKSFTTTFKGTTTREWDTGSTYRVFVKVNGKYYPQNAMAINLEKLTSGEIAGVTVSVAAASTATVGIVYYLVHRKKSNQS